MWLFLQNWQLSSLFDNEGYILIYLLLVLAVGKLRVKSNFNLNNYVDPYGILSAFSLISQPVLVYVPSFRKGAERQKC